MYVFPQCGIGKLIPYNPGNPLVEEKYVPQDDVIMAQGTVNVPISMGDIGLSQMGGDSVAAIKTPSIYGKISGNEFRKLFISNASDEFSMDMTPEARAAQSQNMAKILANLSGWSGLESLALRQCILRSQAFDAMNHLKALRYLSFDKCDFDERELARQPFLTRMKRLQFTALGEHSDDVVRQIAHSSTIEQLRLVAPSGMISASAIEQLSQCPHLEKLNIRFKDATVDDRMLQAICKLKTLRELHLLECKLSLQQIKLLSTYRGPSAIVLSGTRHPLDLQAAMKQIDPRIGFDQAK
jgi:hypothetical protein